MQKRYETTILCFCQSASGTTLVIGGCGAEGEAVCPAPTFEREI